MKKIGLCILLLFSMVVMVSCADVMERIGSMKGITNILDSMTEMSDSHDMLPESAPVESESVSEIMNDKEAVIMSHENRPVEEHGYLSVKGTQIVDESGEALQLRGVSTHGIQWFPDYVSKETFRTLRDDWHINVVRLAMYTDPNVGYNETLHELVDEGVAYAVELDLYVIIDWHILSDGNPNMSKDRAIQFFDAMSKKYKDIPNVIYELCNEPNGDVTWERDIKPYATSVIDVIRQNDKNGLIIVGTPTWSQDVDVVAQNPIDEEENILYALHFYAATHKDALREKLSKALELELPVIVSEFGISDASGNGGIDEDQGAIWLDLLEFHGIGYVAWNLSNKNETSALIQSDVESLSDWSQSDLTPWGQWYVARLRE